MSHSMAFVYLYLCLKGHIINAKALLSPTNRHLSVVPYITIRPSTETYFRLYLRGAMSAVTGIYLFRLLLNIIFLPRDLFLP